MSHLAPLPSVLSWAVIICGECGVPFCLAAEHKRRLQDNGGTFYCPNGHPRVYRESEADRLRWELAEKERLLQATRVARDEARRMRVAAEHSARTSRGHLTRMKKRIALGECPAGCGGKFRHLRRHMARKHPGYEVSHG